MSNAKKTSVQMSYSPRNGLILIVRNACAFHCAYQLNFQSPFKEDFEVKVYIVMEHTDGTGSTPKEMGDLIHGVFFDQRRAEDFIRGIVSYISTYEDRKLFFDNGKAFDEEHTIHFELVEKDSI